jgi:hypothetical protein
VFYTVWCLSKSYSYTDNCKKKLVEKRKEKEKTEKKNTTA